MSLQELQPAHLTRHRYTIDASSDHCVTTLDSPSVSHTAFRLALSQLAAGTSIVTTCGQDGYKLGLTATAVTSVSLDPPLVLVCVDNRTRTAAALKACAPFLIHLLAASQQSLARHFASRIPDKFAGLAHTITASGCPLLEGTLASIECLPYHIYSGGDHTIAVGRVIEVQVCADDTPPLIYFRNQFLNQ
jgi:flavin reductase (DIM6/NTAB) family NADH-FMN oxidoreductase RutF